MFYMNRIFFALFFSCFFICSFSQNKEKLSGNIWNDVKSDGATILKGVKHVYTQPFKWKKDDWITVGGVLASNAIIYAYDEEISEFFINQEESAPQVLKEFGWYYGSPQNFFMVSAGIYGYGLIAKNENFRRTGVLIISSAVASGLFQTITKNGFGRARPSQGVGKDRFKPLSKESGYHSLPSGHTILSITASHAIAKQFKNIWVKSGIYAVGLIAPVSRLWAGAHWLTDVTLGAVVSIAIVDGIDKFIFKQDLIKEEKQISWKLKAGVGTVGLVGTF
mgnify:CR=1 FL=1